MAKYIVLDLDKLLEKFNDVAEQPIELEEVLGGLHKHKFEDRTVRLWLIKKILDSLSIPYPAEKDLKPRMRHEPLGYREGFRAGVNSVREYLIKQLEKKNASI